MNKEKIISALSSILATLTIAIPIAILSYFSIKDCIMGWQIKKEILIALKKENS